MSSSTACASDTDAAGKPLAVMMLIGVAYVCIHELCLGRFKPAMWYLDRTRQVETAVEQQAWHACRRQLC